MQPQESHSIESRWERPRLYITIVSAYLLFLSVLGISILAYNLYVGNSRADTLWSLILLSFGPAIFLRDLLRRKKTGLVLSLFALMAWTATLWTIVNPSWGYHQFQVNDAIYTVSLWTLATSPIAYVFLIIVWKRVQWILPLASVKTLRNGIQLQMAILNKPYKLSKEVNIAFDLKNLRSQSVTLHYQPDLLFDFNVYDSDGNLIYNWFQSEDSIKYQSSTKLPRSKVLKPGNNFNFVAKWKQKRYYAEHIGGPLLAGTYYLKGFTNKITGIEYIETEKLPIYLVN